VHAEHAQTVDVVRIGRTETQIVVVCGRPSSAQNSRNALTAFGSRTPPPAIAMRTMRVANRVRRGLDRFG